MTESPTVKSADRVLDVFELLGMGDRDLTLTEIADRLVIPKSSLSQLLANLVRRNWLSYEHLTRRYSVGTMAARITRASEQAQTLADLARPVLEQLSAATGETAALNQLVIDEAETTATVLAKATLLALLHVGQRSPLYSTSYGKVMLAHFSHETLLDYLARTELIPRTPRTIRSAEELKLQLESIRRDGFGYSFEEHSLGVVGSAKAIVKHDGKCLGVFNVAAAAGRYDAAARRSINDALDKAVNTLQTTLTHAPASTRSI